MRLTLRKIIKETEDISSFIFEPNKPLAWYAGQFMHYTLPHTPTDSRHTDRYFTISSAPHEKHIMLTTRFAGQSSSTFKTALFALKPGDTIEAEGPEGDFTVDDMENQNIVFIAGGIGITPIRSILFDLEHRGKSVWGRLIYASRDEHILWQTELEKFANRHPKFNIFNVIGGSGITESVIEQLVPDFNKTVFYISGPEVMMESVAKKLHALTVQPQNIKRDFFPGYASI